MFTYNIDQREICQIKIFVFIEIIFKLKKIIYSILFNCKVLIQLLSLRKLKENYRILLKRIFHGYPVYHIQTNL